MLRFALLLDEQFFSRRYTEEQCEDTLRLPRYSHTLEKFSMEVLLEFLYAATAPRKFPEPFLELAKGFEPPTL
jgi:hypothetical protein